MPPHGHDAAGLVLLLTLGLDLLQRAAAFLLFPLCATVLAVLTFVFHEVSQVRDCLESQKKLWISEQWWVGC